MRQVTGRFRANSILNAEVRRKGETQKRWYSETDIVIGGVDKSAIEFYFDTRSAGPGMTNLKLVIEPSNFPALLGMMAQADQNAAVKAMVEELRYQICETAEDPLRRKRPSPQ